MGVGAKFHADVTRMASGNSDAAWSQFLTVTDGGGGGGGGGGGLCFAKFQCGGGGGWSPCFAKLQCGGSPCFAKFHAEHKWRVEIQMGLLGHISHCPRGNKPGNGEWGKLRGGGGGGGEGGQKPMFCKVPC